MSLRLAAFRRSRQLANTRDSPTNPWEVSEQLRYNEPLSDRGAHEAGAALLRRGQVEDGPEVLEHLHWSHQAARERGYREAGQIAGILQQLGLAVG